MALGVEPQGKLSLDCRLLATGGEVHVVGDLRPRLDQRSRVLQAKVIHPTSDCLNLLVAQRGIILEPLDPDGIFDVPPRRHLPIQHLHLD